MHQRGGLVHQRAAGHAASAQPDIAAEPERGALARRRVHRIDQVRLQRPSKARANTARRPIASSPAIWSPIAATKPTWSGTRWKARAVCVSCV